MNVFELYGSLGLKTEEFSQGLSSAITDITKFGGIVANVIDVVKKVDNVITTISNTTVSATGDLLTGAFNIAKAFDDNVMGSVDRAEGVVVNAFSHMASAGYDFFRSAVDEGMGFDAALGQVSATLLQTREDFDNNIVSVDGFTGSLRDLAKELGATTKFTATQAGEGLNYMALAGYDAQTSAEMLPKVLDLAAAGAMDLGTASDMVTDAQTALGLSIDDTSVLIDQMAKTASSSNTSVSGLGDAILSIGATGRMLKGGFTELNTALGILADNGKKASEGGNELRRILVRLTAPGQDAAATMESLGFSAYDAQGNIKSLPDMFAELNAAMEGYTQQQKNVAISDIFGQYALAGANALLKTSAERWQELTDEIVDSKGAAKEMADIQLETLPGQVTLLTSAFSGLKTEIFEKVAPTMKGFVETLATGLGMAAEDVRNGDWGLAFRDIGNTAVTLIKQGAMEISNSSSTITEFIDGIVLAADEIGTALFESGSEFMPRLSGHLLYFSESLIQKFADFLSNQENVDTITDTIGVLIDQISTFLDNNSDDLYTVFSTLFDIAISFVDDIFILKRKTIYDILYKKATEILSDLGTNIKKYLDSNEVTKTVNNVFDFIETIAGKLLSTSSEITPPILDFVLDIADRAIDGLAEFLTDEEHLDEIRGTINYILLKLQDFFDENEDELYTILETVIDTGIGFVWKVFELRRKTTARVLGQTIKDILSDAWGGQGGIESHVGWIGTMIVEGLGGGIISALPNLMSGAQHMVSTVLNVLTDGFGVHSPSRVTRDLIGKNIALGIGVGFSEEMPNVIEDIQGSIPNRFDVDPKIAIKSENDKVRNGSRATSGNSYVFEFRIGNINGTTARDAEDFAENVSQLLRAQVFREQAAYI